MPWNKSSLSLPCRFTEKERQTQFLASSHGELTSFAKVVCQNELEFMNFIGQERGECIILHSSYTVQLFKF